MVTPRASNPPNNLRIVPPFAQMNNPYNQDAMHENLVDSQNRDSTAGSGQNVIFTGPAVRRRG
jgi:hypothetical protein